MVKQERGITLLTLVFTIIAMLALVAVAIAMILDQISYDPNPKQEKTNNEVVVSTETPEETTRTPNTIIDELVDSY